MSLAAEKRLRILVLWGPSHFKFFLDELLLNNPKYDIEIVSGDRTSGRSPHAASWGRLLNLRKRLTRGEFDLVVSGPIQNSAWPRPKRLATCLAQAFRFFTYKHRMLDSYWAPWLLSGEAGRKVPLAVVDFLDTSFVLPKDFPLLKAATLYFKINLYFWPRRSLMPLENLYGQRRVIDYTRKLRPLTNGVRKERIPATARPMKERDIDLCFTGNITQQRSEADPNLFGDLTHNPIRRQVYERVQKLQEAGKYKVFCLNDRVAPEEYFELLQRSKLVVCTESYGCETWRHYEAGAAGAVPLANWPYATNYMPYEPDVHAIYFSLIGDDFERTVARALGDLAKLEEISRNVRAFTLAHKERGHVGEMIVEETLKAWTCGRQ
jgi:glycosyltransferase involved in cell wall biosynthesis